MTTNSLYLPVARLLMAACVAVAFTSVRAADSPEGILGRVITIVDGNHPNLFYNQNEIEELRKMIPVQHSPKHLFDRYNAEIKDAVAVKTIPENSSPHAANMKAALSYAIEPTTEKAEAMRASLLSFLNAFPSGLPDCYNTPGCCSSGYSVPWMFDLILTYHPDKLSSAEKVRLKIWFESSAERLKFDTRNPGAPSQSGHDVVLTENREGRSMVAFPNWYSHSWVHPWHARWLP